MGLCGVGCLHSIAKWVLVLCFLAFCIQYWLNKKQHLTSGEEIAAIVKKYSGKCKNQLTINCLHSSHANDMQYTFYQFTIYMYCDCWIHQGRIHWRPVRPWIHKTISFVWCNGRKIIWIWPFFFKYWVSACRCITREMIPLI